MSIYVSAFDPGYAYDPTPPEILVGLSAPVTKIHNVKVIVPITVTDNYAIYTSGISVFGEGASAVSITNLSQANSATVTFHAEVSATADFSISAVDFVGNSTTAFTSGYTITSAYTEDIYSPYITFSNHNPTDRTIINRGDLTLGTSGVTYENVGSVRVKVYDPNGSIAAASRNFRLAEGSVGFIDVNSIQQTVFPTTVEFNVWNISATGNVIVSAVDDAGNTGQGVDGKWHIGCQNNDRLINLVEFLPSHLKGETLEEFVQFFEDFLNTMYTNAESGCNYGILKKIERLASLHNPEDIDMEYIEFFASMMGYGVGLNAGDLGLFTIGTADPSSQDEIDAKNKALRFVVQNLPNWYRIKTTRNSVKIMLYSFGIIGDILHQYSDDYKDNWISYDDNEQINIKSVVPADYYPTPHFSLNVNIGLTTPTWIEQIDEITNAINSIRPINSVFDHIAASLRITSPSTSMNINVRTLLTYHVSHTGPMWTV